jgi:glycosyltransferase involved in cell wall biosynthesis
VHCSSVAQYVEHVSGVPKILDFGDMDSQKWLEYANYKPFPLSLGYWLEGMKMLAAEKRLARRSTCAPRPRAPSGRRSRGYGTGAATDWFPNGVDAQTSSAPDRHPVRRRHHQLHRPHGLLPEPGVHVRASAARSGLCSGASAALKLLIVGADPSPEMQKLGEAARRHRHRLGARRAALHVRGSALMVAPLNIARGTQNKILEAMAMGVPVVTSSPAAGGVDAEP